MSEQTIKVWDTVKHHYAALSLIAAIVASSFVIDNRYVHAEDLRSFSRQQQSTLTEIQRENIKARKQAVEDQIFAIDVKERKTSSDIALKNRLESRHQEYARDLQLLDNRNR